MVCWHSRRAFARGVRRALLHGRQPKRRLRYGALCPAAHAPRHAASRERCARRAVGGARRHRSFSYSRTIDAVERHQPHVGRIAPYLQRAAAHVRQGIAHHTVGVFWAACHIEKHAERRDRKSTRLNSSHGYISYAVFCLKKKKIKSYT